MTSRKIPESAVENLVSDLEGKANIALTNSPYTTNRILEIPQDIKLELNNGTLTLKAGSKVYFGSKSDPLTISTDLTIGRSSNNAEFIMINSDGLSANYWSPTKCYSGSTPPTVTGTALYYNTNDGHCYYTTDGGANWTQSGMSLPICLITQQASTPYVLSIDQIFNGFGYIGSTVFALPGVKVQIPDGRNDDGSCKNRLYTETSVKTFITNGEWSAGVLHGYIGDLTEYGGSQYGFFPAMDSVTKLSEKNLYFDTVTGRYNSWCPVVSFYQDSTGKITSFTPFTVDSVLNSSLSNLSAAGEAKLKSNIQLVNELPANHVAGVLYCIPEK